MSDTRSGVAGSLHENWLRALEEARERVLVSHVRYPYTRGFRLEALPDEDGEETPEQRKARKAARAARRQKETSDAIAAAIKAVDETHAKVVPDANRPDFDLATFEVEAGSPLPDNLKSAVLSRPEWTEGPNAPKAGKVIPFPLTPGGMRGAKSEAGESMGALVDKALDKAISINRFPKDFDANDFSMARYCYAEQQSKTSHLGNLAFQKIAPKEHQFYQALAYYSKESKALGEMVSGTDGGFLAPEIWTNVFSTSGNACR